MKKLLMMFLILFVAAAPAVAGPTRFSAEDAADVEAFAKQALTIKADKLGKLGVKKLVILECYGQYVTSKEVTDSVASQRSAMRTAASQGRMFYNVRTKVDTLEIDKDFYTNTSNRLYQAVKEAFEGNGIEIVSPAEVQQNQAYQDFNLAEEKEGRGVTSGVYKPTVVEKSQKVSTTGLGLFPSSLKMIKVVMNLGEITHNLGAEGFLQVNFKVDKGKESKPILQEFNILLSTDLRAQEVGFEGNKKFRYDFYTQWQPIVTLKNPLISSDDVLESKKGPLDIAKYDKALMDMLYTVTDGIKASLMK